MVCLGSDILISFLRGDPAAAGKVSSLKEGSQGPLKTTVINEYELLKGAGLSKLRDRNQVQVKRLISEMEVLELDSEACDIGVAVKRHGASIWTRDSDFLKSLPEASVRLIPPGPKPDGTAHRSHPDS
ncbi:MAG: type II toxin-antitoxin system VapC family toxin [Thaumarchaeota archaeon]|nr:type II toxin-antitoxin system VapC family toxin [Nitrososphaerota archaeon]